MSPGEGLLLSGFPRVFGCPGGSYLIGDMRGHLGFAQLFVAELGEGVQRGLGYQAFIVQSGDQPGNSGENERANRVCAGAGCSS